VILLLARMSIILLLQFSTYLFAETSFSYNPDPIKNQAPDKITSECIVCHQAPTVNHPSFCTIKNQGKCSRHVIHVSLESQSVYNDYFTKNSVNYASKPSNSRFISCRICHGNCPHCVGAKPANIFAVCPSCHTR
jgi:hypothetical protein